MKKLYFLFLLFFTLVAFGQKNPKTIGFIENKGQIVDQKGRENMSVLYLLNTNGLNVQLKKNGFSYDIYEVKKHSLTRKQKERLYSSSFEKEDTLKHPNYTLEYTYHRIDIDFEHSNSDVTLIAEGKSTDYDNYYNVPSESNGVTNVHKFQKVTYQNIYNNIDVVFSIPEDKSKPVEYNFVVKPGGKISDIQLKFEGAKTELTGNKIKMTTRFGQMEEILPMSWTENGTDKKEVTISYKQIKKNLYGFDSSENLTGKRIVIDPVPVRLWGTYYGGADGGDRILKVITDLNGNVYSGGITLSFTNISTIGAHQSTHWPLASQHFIDYDCFIVKMNSSGTRLWSTYLGGNDQDDFKDLAVDKTNNLLITGSSNSKLNSITSVGSYQQNLNYNSIGSYNNFDAFLAKFDENGIRIWGTFFGGNMNETSHCVSVNELNEIVIGGFTSSQGNISTPGCHKFIFTNSSNDTGHEGFIATFGTNGNRIWGTYFGGDLYETINDLKIDNLNNIYIIGNTGSTNGVSTAGSFQNIKKLNLDGFISKFSAAGIQIWGTYFGGDGEDYLNKLKIGNNTLYIVGKSFSDSNISSTGSFIPIAPHLSSSGYDGVFLKFDFNGNRVWSTYFYEEPRDLDIDNSENIFLIGYTQSNQNIYTPNSYQSTCSFGDGFIQKFNTNGQRIWGTYYGGQSHDDLYAIGYDKINNNFYIGGSTLSTNGIATVSSHQQNYSGGYSDGLIVKFQDCLSAPEISSNSPVCIGNSINLAATGGTNYIWTGPNGFASNQQNPVITNANATHSGQYFCSITGTGGCDDTIKVDVFVGDNIKPAANLTTLPTISGDCNTAVTIIPTATDNCTGAITGTTTDPLNYSIPGNYTIHWSYNDGNGNISTQNQSVVITATPIPTLPSPQDFCVQQTATFNDVTITGQNIQWYDALVGGNLLPGTTPMQHLMNYYASQTVNGCESSRATVQINIFSTPAPTGTDQSLCVTQIPTLADVVVSGTDIRWYATATSTVVLPMTTVLVNGTTYYATQTDGICESVDRLAITITLITTLNAHDYTEEICDDKNDGKETVILTNYHDDLIADVTGCTFAYYYSFAGAMGQVASDRITDVNYILAVGLHTVYVRITSGNGCHQVVSLNFTLFSKPVIPITDIMPICEGSSISLDAGAGYDYYLWSTGETSSSITVSTSGNYSVTVRENHVLIPYCESVKNFTVVKSNIATVLKVVPIDWTVNQNSITVLLTGTSVGDYEYSLDGIHYQDSNTFTGLESGEYTVYVKDKNGCGIQPEDFYLLMYPKFFTPNGDGYNDVWKIQLSEKEANLTVKIFDRFGKLLKALDNTTGWNGTFNGRELPSTDYWFTVIRADGKEYRGHFALKR